jgi:peptidoglycan hydrolase CwlO-like protein
MKKSLIFISISFLIYSCSNTIGQQPSEEMKKDQEFENLMKKVKETRINNQKIIGDVDKKTTQVVEKTAQTITNLKEENKQLKKELNNTNEKYNSIDDTISNINFTLRPVSGGKENR